MVLLGGADFDKKLSRKTFNEDEEALAIKGLSNETIFSLKLVR